MIRLKLTFFAILFLLMCFSSYSQVSKDSLEFKVDLNLSGRKISGTFSQLVASGGLNINLLYRNWHLENKTTYRYNETNTRLIEDNWYDLISLKFYPGGSKKFFPGVFYHFDNNLIYRVKSRHHYGIGVGSELDQGQMKLSMLAAVANENAEFNGSEFANSDLDFSTRNNGLFLFKLYNAYSIVNEQVKLSFQLFYFQSLKESSDYDIWITPRISVNVFKSLSFHIIYDYRFENVHLVDLSNYNDILMFGFNLNLSND